LVARPAPRRACVCVPTAMSRAPRTASALAHGRSGAAVKTLPSTRTMSASPAISAHVPQASDPGDGLLEGLVSLREHEPNVPPAVLRIAVERAAGDDGDPEPLDEIHRERPVVREWESREVGHHVVRATGRAAIEARDSEATHEEVPFACGHPREIRSEERRVGKGGAG